MKLQDSLPACVATCLLLGGCDQSINDSGAKGPPLTGLYCDLKANQEQTCKAGDVVRVAEGREHLLCDWSWQVVHEPGNEAVLCIYRGLPRDTRSASGPE